MTEILSSAWPDKFHNFGVLQKHLSKFLQDDKNRRKFISVFRGSFKTTVLLGYCVWLFVKSIVEGKPVSICYNTSTKENAGIFGDDFRQTLINAKKLHWVFPEVPRTPSEYRRWSQKMVEYKSAKFHCASLETRQVMRHYTVIINDDLVNDDNAFSETERQIVIRKWKLQKSILTKYKKHNIGTEIDVGTPYHPKDLISYLIKNVSSYKKFIVPYALPDEDGILDLRRKKGILTMPEMYCWEDFQEKRQEMGASLFATQYELKIIDERDYLAKEEWIKFWVDLPRNYQRIMIIDPATYHKDDDPGTGVLIADCDPHGHIYVLYAEEVNLTPVQLIRLMEDLKAKYNPDEIYMEKEKYSITLADCLEHLQTKLNFSLVSPYGRDKMSRILRLRQYFETGRVYLKRDMTTLIDRIINFPDCPKHLLDCLAYFIDVMNPPKGDFDRYTEEEEEDEFTKEIEKIKKIFSPHEGENYDDYF